MLQFHLYNTYLAVIPNRRITRCEEIMSHFKTIERDGKYITRNMYDVQFHGEQPRVQGQP